MNRRVRRGKLFIILSAFPRGGWLAIHTCDAISAFAYPLARMEYLIYRGKIVITLCPSRGTRLRKACWKGCGVATGTRRMMSKIRTERMLWLREGIIKLTNCSETPLHLFLPGKTRRRFMQKSIRHGISSYSSLVGELV